MRAEQLLQAGRCPTERGSMPGGQRGSCCCPQRSHDLSHEAVSVARSLAPQDYRPQMPMSGYDVYGLREACVWQYGRFRSYSCGNYATQYTSKM